MSCKVHEKYRNSDRSSDKALDDLTEDCLDVENADDDEENEDDIDAGTTNPETVTLQHEKKRFEAEDKPFWEAYNLLAQEQLNVASKNSEESYMNSVVNQQNRTDAKITDHLKRSMLHVAVEQNHENFVKYLVDLGLDVNAREGCGMTPLSLAVLGKNIVLCRFFIESGARHSGPLFTSIPSPLFMAEHLGLSEILHIFDEDRALSDDEDSLITAVDATFHKNPSRHDSTSKEVKECNRTYSGFVTPLVGDVGTCKTNNAAMGRSGSYQWVGLCPGDLHNKGYFCEAVFKVHGSSGFHYLLHEVLKRKRITSEVFKKKKFQDNNLVKVREAINDACRSYGISAALEFANSNMFPSREEFLQTDNASLMLLTRFKEWLSILSKGDIAFEHRATAFLFYGPLQRLYDVAISYGDGVAREVVYQAQAPMYAQLGFRNYYTEVFRHIVNFLVKWPKATRVLLQKNCCVNLLGIVS